MKVAILGAGLIEVTTAHALRCRGNDVVVIDRQPAPGRETSFANGSLLTPSMPEPWNAPGCWRVLLSSIGRADAALQLHLRALPSLGGWGLEFLRNSRRRVFARNTVSNLKLALYSMRMMDSLRSQADFDYAHATPGSLRIFAAELAWKLLGKAPREFRAKESRSGGCRQMKPSSSSPLFGR